MEWLITIILGLIMILIVCWKVMTSVNYWKIRGVPYVKPVPFFGNILEVILMKKSIFEHIGTIYKQLEGERFGGFMQFSKPVLLIRDPELISQVLIKDFIHFHDRGFPKNEKREPLTATLVTLTGNEWRIIRHKITPTFTSGKLKTNMFKQIVECTDEAIEFLKGKKEALDVKQYMLKFNLNVIGLVAFGLKVDALNEKSEESKTFFKHSTRFFAPSIKTLLNVMITTSFPSIGDLLRLKFIDEEVSEFFMNLVKDTINYREKTNTKRNDFIQIMLDLKEQEMIKFSGKVHENYCRATKQKEESLETEDKELLDQLDKTPAQLEYTTPVFTDDCIAAQSFIFINAGSETAASMLSFGMYHLAKNPHIQRKVQKEIDDVLSTHHFDYYAVKCLVYLEQVINEVMRLHPPAGVLARICTEDYIIPGTDKLIEKGVLVSIPVQAIQKDPQYFPDPEKFNPDRFEDMNNIPKGVFLPFGDGPRICIAKRLAMMQMKIYLAKLMFKYNVSLSDKTQEPLKMVPNSFVLDVVGGLWIHFEERH